MGECGNAVFVSPQLSLHWLFSGHSNPGCGPNCDVRNLPPTFVFSDTQKSIVSVPAAREAEAVGSFEPRSLKPAWATW